MRLICPSNIQAIALGLLLLARLSPAQDPALAGADLAYTQSVIAKSRLIAEVELRVGENEYNRYRYERTADLEKIIEPAQVYARSKGKGWVKSDDFDKMGDAVDSQTAAQLDILASVPDTPFATPRIRDEKQGGIVWKFIERTKGKGVEYFTYERTREHPHPDGVYPRCTFAKQPNDTDGKLLLAEQRSQMRQEDKLIPAVITYRYEPIASPDGEPPEIWITGEVFSKNDILFFRMDKPVRDNPLGNVVLLGSTKAGMKVLLPMYMRAAEKKMKLRLYGSLMPFSGTFPGKKTALPNVQFITSKAHMPSDPDELPEDQKIIIQPGDSLPGFDVKVK